MTETQPNKVVGIITMKCPRCAKGDLFESKNPYAFGKITEMKKNCPNCELRYEREPGFFIGAMYVSYAINIAFFVIAIVAFFTLLDDFAISTFFFSYVGFMILIFPITYRISRAIWLNLFTDFDPEKRGER